jgi:hypothetical protein
LKHRLDLDPFFKSKSIKNDKVYILNENSQLWFGDQDIKFEEKIIGMAIVENLNMLIISD